MTGEELFTTLMHSVRPGSVFVFASGANWLSQPDFIREAWNAAAARVGSSDDIAQVVLNLPHQEQERLYRLLYTLGHRINR